MAPEALELKRNFPAGSMAMGPPLPVWPGKLKGEAVRAPVERFME